jgi:hypothetical protein
MLMTLAKSGGMWLAGNLKDILAKSGGEVETIIYFLFLKTSPSLFLKKIKNIFTCLQNFVDFLVQAQDPMQLF